MKKSKAVRQITKKQADYIASLYFKHVFPKTKQCEPVPHNFQFCLSFLFGLLFAETLTIFLFLFLFLMDL